MATKLTKEVVADVLAKNCSLNFTPPIQIQTPIIPFRISIIAAKTVSLA